MTTLEDEGELFPTSPDEHDYKMPEEDSFEGFNTRMTQVMNHFQRQECCCFLCCQTGHFMREYPQREAFHAWQKELKLQRGRSAPKGTHPKESTTVNAWVAGAGHSTPVFIDGPTANWLGPEVLVRLKVEGGKLMPWQIAVARWIP